MSSTLLRLRREVSRIARASSTPLDAFHNHHYLRHNARRLEHLSSLGISVAGGSVLEVGAGIGDHSHYFLDRGCRMTITEARPGNLSHLRKRYPSADVRHLDLETPVQLENAPFDVVYCYGTLYHLSRPEPAIAFLGQCCSGTLLMETCVSFGDELRVNLVPEDRRNPSQACSGTGCRPTRPWVVRELKKYFEFVYLPVSQPNHEEFPVDWSRPDRHTAELSRAVFVASHGPIDSPMLSNGLPNEQVRHP
jgi:SAM-dependent methyltransferase